MLYNVKPKISFVHDPVIVCNITSYFHKWEQLHDSTELWPSTFKKKNVLNDASEQQQHCYNDGNLTGKMYVVELEIPHSYKGRKNIVCSEAKCVFIKYLSQYIHR